MDDPTQPFQPGDAGRPTAPPGYEILGELGRGGMGVVYKVRHVALDRVVALKVILAGAHATPADRQRFLAEAQAVARLRHPNVVQVYEVGEHAGLPYFTLEYVPGGSLGRHAAEPLLPRAVAELVERIARGVAAAHAAGIVHRDLKPDNVLLEADGTPKVCDFGLAKLTGSGDLSVSGVVYGTPSYMAPEQAAGDGKRAGPAADVWALGAILYRLLTGRPPFRGATAWETIKQVMDAPVVPPTKLLSVVPAGLEAVCLKCLRKEPGERYESAVALADDLGRWLRGEPVAAKPQAAWWRRRWVLRVQLVAVAGLAVVVTTWTAFNAGRPGDPLAPAELPPTPAAAVEPKAVPMSPTLPGAVVPKAAPPRQGEIRFDESGWPTPHTGPLPPLFDAVSDRSSGVLVLRPKVLFGGPMKWTSSRPSARALRKLESGKAAFDVFAAERIVVSVPTNDPDHWVAVGDSGSDFTQVFGAELNALADFRARRAAKRTVAGLSAELLTGVRYADFAADDALLAMAVDSQQVLPGGDTPGSNRINWVAMTVKPAADQLTAEVLVESMTRPDALDFTGLVLGGKIPSAVPPLRVLTDRLTAGEPTARRTETGFQLKYRATLPWSDFLQVMDDLLPRVLP